MHDPKFLKLEGSWRGLHYLVMNTETGTVLKLSVLNITKRELFNDLSRRSSSTRARSSRRSTRTSSARRAASRTAR